MVANGSGNTNKLITHVDASNLVVELVVFVAVVLTAGRYDEGVPQYPPYAS